MKPFIALLIFIALIAAYGTGQYLDHHSLSGQPLGRFLISVAVLVILAFIEVKLENKKGPKSSQLVGHKEK